MEPEASIEGTEVPAGQPAETPAPEAAAAPTPPPEAPTEHQLDTPFRLEEVPEEYRSHVERYIASTRPGLTRAFQDAASQREQANEALEFVGRLESPDTAFEALTTVLAQYGLELSEEDWQLAQSGQLGDPHEGEGEDGEPPAWARRLIERAEADDADAEVASEAEARETLRTHVNTSLTTRAEQHGWGETHADVPEPIRNGIAAFAAVLPNGQDGLPNMGAAEEAFDAAVALEVTRILKSKTPDPVPPGGGPGERRVDVKDQKDRMRLSEEIAARHFAGTAT